MLRVRPLYFLLPAIAVIGLVLSAMLIWNYRPADEAVAGAPTPIATPSSTDEGPSPSFTSEPTDAPPTPGLSPSPPPANRLAKQSLPESVPPAELTGYIWPARHALITSRFAPRDFGAFLVIDGQEIHDGLDLATHCGNKVRAAHDGTVLYAGRNFDPYFGYWGDADAIYARLERLGQVNDQPIVVVIDDGNGYRSVYVHLQRADVEAGMEVKVGDFIGLEGATGFATGCHVHYGLIRMDGPWQDLIPGLARFGYPLKVRERVDPLKVLPWGDEFAPQRLRDKVYGTPSPSPLPTAPPELPNQ
ncbi:MAG: M23 family metallopeptidase [Candidatus Limnocylindrales bacterium]